MKTIHPVFIFLIEALGPISCKYLNKLKKKCPKNLFLANHATLHIPYVMNTPVNRCHGKVNHVLNTIFKVCKISKTKKRRTYYTGLVVKLFFDATLLMTDIIRKSSITDRVTNLATLPHQISH